MTDDSNTQADRLRNRAGAVAEWLPTDDRTLAAVAAVAAVALLARFVALGYRVMHFDEARVAYWTLRYVETGDWIYRREIHGPLVQHVDAWLFSAFEPSDFVARAPVALVGGLLPLTALLFRDYLEDDEVVAASVFLALNPLLLYYSRFFRSDVLVAAFMLAALGYVARGIARRQPGDLYVAGAFLALGFASKENALVYLVCWVGMLVAVAGLELLYPRRFDSRGAYLRTARQRVIEGGRWLRRPVGVRWGGHAVGGLVVFGVLTVLLYSPRTGGTPMWQTDPLGAVDATVAAFERGFAFWGENGSEVPACYSLGVGPEDPFTARYRCNLERSFTIMTKGAAAVSVVGLVGVVSEQFRRPRVLVTGAALWAIASFLGYPLASDIAYPAWLGVHVVVPLAIPAGVGLATFARWGRDALADDDSTDAAIAGLLVVLVVAGMVVPAVQVSYLAPQSGVSGEANVVQFAQPSGHMQEAVAAMDEAVANNDGVDVVVYGPDFVHGGNGTFDPGCLRWLTPMAPASWYLYRSGAEIRCASTEVELRSMLDEHDPPVVVTSQGDARIAGPVLGDRYAGSAYGLRLWSSATTTAVFYFDTTRVDREANASVR
ncbi:TIGR03663 family protein [Halobacteriales archaeon QS_1_68_20]|nr:MAG: TIGR03663 family protein [Halobacteriales archaeon QS_1_68_20]